MIEERPPCPRCSFPYEPGAAERYWEARWRDESAETERLRASLQYYAENYCEGWCEDNPPNANFEDCDGCRARLALADMTNDRKSKGE